MKERKSDVPENPEASAANIEKTAPESHEDAPQIVYVGSGDTNARTRNLGRPFPKGVSGNPSGRPKDVLGPTIRSLLSGEKLVAHVANVVKKADQGDVRATQLLWEYGWGKPPMAAEDREALLSGDGINPLFAIFGVKR